MCLALREDNTTILSLMKQQVFYLFNLTVGRVVRLFQASLNQDKSPEGVFHLIKQLALQDSAQYALSNFTSAMPFNTRPELWSYCIERIPQLKTEGGLISEFGVWKGESINFFAKSCPKARVFGFDSFEGLEEDWYGRPMKKGEFSTEGQLPECEDNVSLLKGWFIDTLPEFCNQLQQHQILLLHMDADTYKPTAYVLDTLKSNLRKGSIVIFDEYFGYPNFRSHEFKAWQEFIKSNGIQYRYVGYTESQVAVEIL